MHIIKINNFLTARSSNWSVSAKFYPMLVETPFFGGVINPKTYLNHEVGSKGFFLISLVYKVVNLFVFEKNHVKLARTEFSPTRPLWAELVLESPCPSVCLCACLRHGVQFFSRPLIRPQITWPDPGLSWVNPPSLPYGGGDGDGGGGCGGGSGTSQKLREQPYTLVELSWLKEESFPTIRMATRGP